MGWAIWNVYLSTSSNIIYSEEKSALLKRLCVHVTQKKSQWRKVSYLLRKNRHAIRKPEFMCPLFFVILSFILYFKVFLSD